jgi:hypothetical protein
LRVAVVHWTSHWLVSCLTLGKALIGIGMVQLFVCEYGKLLYEKGISFGGVAPAGIR